MLNSDPDLAQIDADLEEVRANVNHGEAQHNPWALQALRVAEQLRAELNAIGGMQTIQHEGNRLRVITVALHDRLCAVRVASRQETNPPVLHCHFCGFCYPPLTVDSAPYSREADHA